jgi:phospholipase/lecithinase/hemolysin
VTFAAKASDATGHALDELLALEQLIEGSHIIRLNVFSLLKAVEADPAHFGFTDTHPCLTTAVCSDPTTRFSGTRIT